MRILPALVFVLAAGCTSEIGGATGDDTGTGDDGTGETGTGSASTSTFSASIDQTAVTTELGKQVKLVVTVASQGTFAGTVTAAPTAITGWTLSSTPTSVALTAGGTQTMELDVTIPTDTAMLAPMLAVALSDGTNTINVSSAFTVANQVTVMLDAVGTGVHATWPAKNAPLKILSGTTVIFHNADTVVHRIHASGGVMHEPNDLAAGADYKATDITDGATWYCHDHEGGGDSRIINVE